MKPQNFLTIQLAAIVGCTMLFGTAATAQTPKIWNMCRWDEIPEHILKRITRRADYEDLLRRMFEDCPEQALTLTAQPTGSVNETDADWRSGRSDPEADKGDRDDDSNDADTRVSSGSGSSTGGGSGDTGGGGSTGGPGSDGPSGPGPDGSGGGASGPGGGLSLG